MRETLLSYQRLSRRDIDMIYRNGVRKGAVN